ncbi:hypothetical protein EDB80DRAFT_768626 [Ilyonectria destructans]|nr:hypothetical protein EDB80DRAFT_768626 [Ilyonectria destructans]
MPPRRSHTKSRKGCRECKRRKVKCNEQRPGCFNCTRHGSHCTYADPEGNSHLDSLGSPLSPSAVELRSESQDGMGEAANSTDASAKQDFLCLSITADGMRVLPSPSPRTTGSSEFGSLGGRELELMHHYSVNTCSSLALRDDVCQVWRFVILQEGYNHAFVMHGILAIGAMHKSVLIPSMRQEYLTVSAHHQVIGLEGFRLRLRQVNEDNWKPVFSFAAITILYVCLLPARCEHLTLTEPISSIIELFTVIRGMRSFLSPFFKNLLSTSFAPLHHGIWTSPQEDLVHGEGVDPSLDQACLPSDTFQALRNLKPILDDQQPDIRKDYLDAIAALERCATQLARNGMYVDSGIVMLWVYTIPERVLQDIKLRAPLALLVLAYFCVFWGILESRLWYLRGWAKQVLADIDLHLAHHQQLTALMKWPKREILSISCF